MKQVDFLKLFDNINNLRVGVLGDIMLDTYWWGKVDRVSPEAPVPIVALGKREQRIGGAGNVALNACSMGAEVTILSVSGDDADGDQLRKLLELEKINTAFLVRSQNRITTNKIRIMGRNQQMMRLDAEMVDDLLEEDELRLLDSLRNYISAEKPHIIILEDYNKGVLTATLIAEVINICNENKILVSVDPKRRNFFAYKGADIFKPNLKEAKEGLNIISDEMDIDALKQIHDMLHEKLHHNISLITLSEQGVFYEADGSANIIHSHIRNISDVSGAGDTVIAVASLVYAATKNVELMAQVANIAGGLVCEEVGTAAINKEKLLHECRLLLQ